MLKVHAEAITV